MSDKTDSEPRTSAYAELTGFQRDLLVVVAGNSGEKGLSIKEALEEYYEEPVNHGRLYPNLDELSQQGYIDKFPIDNRTNGYQLSNQGRDLLTERLTWEREQWPDQDTMNEIDVKKLNNKTIDEGQLLDDETGTDGRVDSSFVWVEATENEGSVPSMDCTALADLPVDDRFKGKIAVSVEEKKPPNERKNDELLICDRTGERALFDVWKKHDVGVDWAVGKWYVLTEVRLKEWDRNGTTVRKLSSSRDTTVTRLSEPAAGDNQYSSKSDSKESELKEETRKSGKNSILEDIMAEFNDDTFG